VKEENNNNHLAPSLGLILIVLYSIFKEICIITQKTKKEKQTAHK
jgi:hypothetical protein